MDTNTKDWIQSLSWAASALTLVFSALKFFLFDRKRDLQQRTDELSQRKVESDLRDEDMRWRRVETGKKLVDDLLASKRCRCARKLIDYPGGRVFVVGGNKVLLKESDSIKALDVSNVNLSTNDHFIRDCFDNFFYHIAILEHWIQQELVDLNDVKYPVEYYVRALKRNQNLWPIAEAYLEKFKFIKAQEFMRHFV
ncbi:MAG TPA: hypothetical protein PL070_13570 [Flavobacteriales bacterium]|nr:hypothetical protein [Flavobacteriales bacterium]